MPASWKPLAALAADVRHRRVSSRELVADALARIDRVDPHLHAFVALDGERALAEADAVDARVARGEDPGPLAGVPLGVKDMEDAMGWRTTYGSLLYREPAAATKDSVLVARLRAAGCVVLGKLNTPDHGFSADTTNALFGHTHNPWQPGRTPGGSSGACAAALVSGMIPLATAGDSGGSIRIPAAISGLPAFKPSNGRVPVGGPTPPGNGWLGVRSIMARTVADTVYALTTIVGHDPTDLISLPDPVPAWPTVLDGALPTRVVWAPAPGWPVDGEVAAVLRAAVDRICAGGGRGGGRPPRSRRAPRGLLHAGHGVHAAPAWAPPWHGRMGPARPGDPQPDRPRRHPRDRGGLRQGAGCRAPAPPRPGPSVQRAGAAAAVPHGGGSGRALRRVRHGRR